MTRKGKLISLIQEKITHDRPNLMGVNELSIEIVDYLIANNAVTVACGEWIPVKDNTFMSPCYECSICGRRLNTFGVPTQVAPFCHCGAKMDEVSE